MNSVACVLFLAASASASLSYGAAPGLGGLGLGLNAAPLGLGLNAAAAPLGLGYGAAIAAPVVAKAAPLVSSYSVAAPAPIIAQKPLGVYGSGLGLGYGAAYAAAPVALTAASQYKAQDAYGNVNFGYANINSARKEAIGPYGAAAGSYSYVDSYGIPQQVDYVADAAGFRILSATNLPIGPSVPEAPLLLGPAPVEDTPEVAAAKAEFQAAFDAAVAAGKH